MSQAPGTRSTTPNPNTPPPRATIGAKDDSGSATTSTPPASTHCCSCAVWASEVVSESRTATSVPVTGHLVGDLHRCPRLLQEHGQRLGAVARRRVRVEVVAGRGAGRPDDHAEEQQAAEHTDPQQRGPRSRRHGDTSSSSEAWSRRRRRARVTTPVASSSKRALSTGPVGWSPYHARSNSSEAPANSWLASGSEPATSVRYSPVVRPGRSRTNRRSTSSATRRPVAAPERALPVAAALERLGLGAPVGGGAAHLDPRRRLVVLGIVLQAAREAHDHEDDDSDERGQDQPGQGRPGPAVEQGARPAAEAVGDPPEDLFDDVRLGPLELGLAQDAVGLGLGHRRALLGAWQRRRGHQMWREVSAHGRTRRRSRARGRGPRCGCAGPGRAAPTPTGARWSARATPHRPWPRRAPTAGGQGPTSSARG